MPEFRASVYLSMVFLNLCIYRCGETVLFKSIMSCAAVETLNLRCETRKACCGHISIIHYEMPIMMCDDDSNIFIAWEFYIVAVYVIT